MLGDWTEDAVRPFTVDGEEWYMRITQGGGISWDVPPDPPVPVVCFRPVRCDDARNFEVIGEPGKWDGYADNELRALLAKAVGGDPSKTVGRPGGDISVS